MRDRLKFNGSSRATATVLSTLLIVLFAGCQDSDPVFPVTGAVKFTDGTAARFGIIEFRRQSSTPVVARGKIESDGSFTVRTSGRADGLTQGRHQAIIIQVAGGYRASDVEHRHGHIVDDKYRDYRTTDLEVNVTPEGPNDFNLVVEPKQHRRKL